MIDITKEYAGRWPSILYSIGMSQELFNGKHHPCPFCDKNGDGGKDRFRFIAEKELLLCGQCGTRGGINSYMEWTGLNFKDSCNEIRGSKMDYAKNVIKKKDPMPVLKRIHSKLKKITPGDTVDLYLKSRGINSQLNQDVFIGREMPYYGGGKVYGTYDCMVSRITNVDDKLESYHLVYLTPDGRKIENAQAKIIVTPVSTISGAKVKLSQATDIVAIAEGVETAMKVGEDEGIPCWASISAIGMEKIQLPDRIKTVYIYADNDESFTGQAAAFILAKRLKSKRLTVTVFLPKDSGADFLDVFNGEI